MRAQEPAGSQDSEDDGRKFRHQASASTADENTSAARASAVETDKSNTHRFGEKMSVPTVDAEGTGDELDTGARSYLRQASAWCRVKGKPPHQQALV